MCGAVSQEWSKVCRQMKAAFMQSNFEGGVVAGVQAVTGHLKQHFLSDSHDRNELPDKPVVREAPCRAGRRSAIDSMCRSTCQFTLLQGFSS